MKWLFNSLGTRAVRLALSVVICCLAAVAFLSCDNEIPGYGNEELPETINPSLPDNSGQYPIDVVLPKRIYAVVGDTLQLFFRGMIGAVNPYNYDILVTCEEGKKFPRYFEYVPQPEDIGELPFAVTLRDDKGETMGYAECMIEVVEKTCGEDVLHILPFGDSLTSGGIWCHHADSRTPTNVKFCGAKEYMGTHYFGVGGWSWSSYTSAVRPGFRFQVHDVNLLHIGAAYTSDNGYKYTVLEINVTNGVGNVLMSVDKKTYEPGSPAGILKKTSGGGDPELAYSSFQPESSNPLWNGERMTFRPYVERYAEGRVDAVYVLLGWNNLKPWQTDFSELLSTVDTFCSTLHDEYPTAKVYIMGLEIPSINGGIGNSYGATGSGYADGYGLCIGVLNLNRAYQKFADERSSYVEFLNVSCQFDTEYNMPATDKNVNLYNPETEVIGTNGVHPGKYGYYQIGDVAARSIYAMKNKDIAAGVPMLRTK